MRKLIKAKGTMYEQNRKDLAIIETTQEGGKVINLNAWDIEEAIINGDVDALDMISVDVDNEGPKTVYPAINDQTITPEGKKTGLSQVTVKAVTSNIDPNIKPENIREGKQILGVWGTMEEGAKVSVQDECLIFGSHASVDGEVLTIE